MNIAIKIEQLVLDGLTVTPAQRLLLKRAMETGLADLVAARGLNAQLRSGGSVPSLPARNIEITGSSNPTILGHQIARAVHGAISDE